MTIISKTTYYYIQKCLSQQRVYYTSDILKTLPLPPPKKPIKKTSSPQDKKIFSSPPPELMLVYIIPVLLCVLPTCYSIHIHPFINKPALNVLLLSAGYTYDSLDNTHDPKASEKNPSHWISTTTITVQSFTTSSTYFHLTKTTASFYSNRVSRCLYRSPPGDLVFFSLNPTHFYTIQFKFLSPGRFESTIKTKKPIYYEPWRQVFVACSFYTVHLYTQWQLCMAHDISQT